MSMGRGDCGGDESWEIMPGDAPDESPSFVPKEACTELPEPSVMVRLNAGGSTFPIGDDATVWLDCAPPELACFGVGRRELTSPRDPDAP